MVFSARGFDQDMRLAELNIDKLRLPRAGMGAEEFTPLSTVPETVAVEPFPGVELPAQNPTTDLMFLRAQFPFNQILPFPDRSISAVLTANVAFDLVVPDGSILGKFESDGTAVYYVSRNGSAHIPTAANSPTSGSPDDSACDALVKPEKNLWYLSGLRAFSIISASNMIVQLHIWKAENWPRR